MTEQPRVTDNDAGEISVAIEGKELRGWSYKDDAERRIKMLAAREYVEGWCDACDYHGPAATPLDGRLSQEVNMAQNSLIRQSATEADARRYRRLQVLGCAPAYTRHLEDGNVLRFSNLDEFVDADIAAQPSRGEASVSRPAPKTPAAGALQALVNEQAEDDALWCLEPTITEHLLQQALRRLHHEIEGTSPVSRPTRGKGST